MRPNVVIICALIVFGTGTAYLLSGDFKSAKAEAARKRYQHDVKKLEEEFEKKMEAIKKKYKSELQKALADAMKKSDLEEANKIKGEIDKLNLTGDKIKNIILSNKWTNDGPKSNLVVTFHKDGTLSTQSNKHAVWKIEENKLYIKWHGDWDLATVSKSKIDVRDKKGNGYTWVAIDK